MGIAKTDVFFMAAVTGLIVANLYYGQPLIVLMAEDFGIPESMAGRTTYLAQAGYAIGLFLMIPLGDKLERKKQILVTSFLAVLALVLAAVAQSFLILQMAFFLIGFTSIVPQLVLPMAVALSDESQRGKVIGTVMSGLLIGILVSRTVSGFIGAWLGWREMFWIAAGIGLLLVLLMSIRLPQNQPSFQGTYKALYRSLFVLMKEQAVLRQASLVNSLAFAQFGAFWTTMVLLLSATPFHFDSATIGLFGLVGACGAFAAPLVGKMGGRGDSGRLILIGILMLLGSFIIFYFSATSVIGMIIGIVFLDLGLQVVHVSNQTRIYALLPEARNRLNTVFMAFSFMGTAFGSAFGLAMWGYFGWAGVCIGGIAMAFLALILFIVQRRK